jgi:Tol biopolymer transport system component
MSTASESAPLLVSPVPLFDYPDLSVSDYRLAISPDGSQVIFERNVEGAQTQLYIATLGDTVAPTVFPPVSPFIPSTRPDWSWTNGQVAFCAGKGEEIVITDAAGTSIRELQDTAKMIYPAWLPSGLSLAVMNQNARNKKTHKKFIHPRTSIIDSFGDIELNIVANHTVWAGMPCVNPGNANQFVFAGQWRQSDEKYHQDKNYVWFVDRSTDPITLRPLDQKANQGGAYEPKFQGRAPWYSPDGNWVAFESSRADPNAYKKGVKLKDLRYAIFIQDAAGASPAMQVTDIEYNANHAKWFPNGIELAATLYQTPFQSLQPKKRGLYRLDVTSFVNPAG